MSLFATLLRTILLSAWAAGAGGFAGMVGMVLGRGTHIDWATQLENVPLGIGFLLVAALGLTPLGILFGILFGIVPTVLLSAFLSAVEKWRPIPWAVWPVLGSIAGLAVTSAWPIGDSPAGTAADWTAVWTIGGAVSMTSYWFLTHAMFEERRRARA